MTRFPLAVPALAGAMLSLAFPALAHGADASLADHAAALFCADDASLLKWALGVLGLPVAASILANFRNRLPAGWISAIDIVALNFVRAAERSAPALVLWAILAVSGCTSSQQAAVAGFEATALKGAQAAEDNNLLLWRTDACGTPFSAIVRNAETIPGLVPALSALCLPNADKANSGELLKAAPARP